MEITSITSLFHSYFIPILILKTCQQKNNGLLNFRMSHQAYHFDIIHSIILTVFHLLFMNAIIFLLILMFLLQTLYKIYC